MRMRRSMYAGSDVGNAATNAEGMTDTQLDERISEFEKSEKTHSVEKPKSCEEEVHLKKRFKSLYTTYRAVIERVEEIRQSFLRLEERYMKCQKARERDALESQIKHNHSRLNGRFKRFESVLPDMHAMLKEIQLALRKGRESSG